MRPGRAERAGQTPNRAVGGTDESLSSRAAVADGTQLALEIMLQCSSLPLKQPPPPPATASQTTTGRADAYRRRVWRDESGARRAGKRARLLHLNRPTGLGRPASTRATTGGLAVVLCDGSLLLFSSQAKTAQTGGPPGDVDSPPPIYITLISLPAVSRSRALTPAA
jgi:hypothetical protein